jgi:hypothetical protein
MDKSKFFKIKHALRNVILTENYISMTDSISLGNFIKQLYPTIDINEMEIKDLKILGYRILLTR